MSRLVITVSCILIVVVRNFWPEFFENFDLISISLIGIAIIPWVSQYIEKIAISGVGEIALRKANEAISTADDAKRIALATDLRSDDLFIASSKYSSADLKGVNGSNLGELASRYVKERNNRPRGNARTLRMTEIFRDMTQEARDGTYDPTELTKWLSSDDPGKQLAAIAYFHENTQSANVSAIIDAIESSRHSFIQHWGIRTIQRIVEELGLSSLNQKDINKIRFMKSVVPSNTGREQMLVTLNGTIDYLLRESF